MSKFETNAPRGGENKAVAFGMRRATVRRWWLPLGWDIWRKRL